MSGSGLRMMIVAIALALASPMLLGACTRRSGLPPTSATAPLYEVKTANVGTLGPVLVDGDGFTLYAFMPDKRSAPTCTGACAAAWPPLVLSQGVSHPIGGPGVRSGLLGTVKRSDGSEQVTYAGWPLYRWTGDTQPGQVTGEGLDNLGGLWYAIALGGAMVR